MLEQETIKDIMDLIFKEVSYLNMLNFVHRTASAV
jgi:hypothetical protein